MELYKVIILAIEQGITELLPVSSSAHLIITAKLLDIKMDTYLLAVLHFGTTISILIFFARTLFQDILKKESIQFYLKIVVSTIPVAIVGLLLESTIEQYLRSDIYIVSSLILWGIIMILVERKYKDHKDEDLREISWKQSLIMGISQIFALIPGTSRSGVTTIAGTLSGVNKYSAIQYSFILGIPVLLGTSTYEIYKYAPTEGFDFIHILGILVSAIFGFIALYLLKGIRKAKWLTIFGVYRILIGIVLLLVSII